MQGSFKFWTAVVFPLCFCLLLNACVSKNNPQELAQQQAAKARVELALGYMQEHQFSEAKRNLDKALAHAPDYYFAQAALAYFYQRQGQIVQAKQAYQQAIKLDNSQGETHHNYATLLCSQGEFSQSYAEFEQALASPNYVHQADSYANLALCSASEANAQATEKWLQQLAKFDPQRAQDLRKQLQNSKP